MAKSTCFTLSAFPLHIQVYSKCIQWNKHVRVIAQSALQDSWGLGFSQAPYPALRTLAPQSPCRESWCQAWFPDVLQWLGQEHAGESHKEKGLSKEDLN